MRGHQMKRTACVMGFVLRSYHDGRFFGERLHPVPPGVTIGVPGGYSAPSRLYLST
jgi:hypothetical protein